MYFVFLYENRSMKPVEIVLSSGGGQIRKNDGGVNLIKMHCKHICKYHNAPSCPTVIC
jgi:hypothetical protein